MCLLDLVLFIKSMLVPREYFYLPGHNLSKVLIQIPKNVSRPYEFLVFIPKNMLDNKFLRTLSLQSLTQSP